MQARVAQSRMRSHIFVDLRSDFFYFIIETHSLPNAHSLLPSQLYLDHSHCLVLAPATLAALPSTRAIETRLLPSSLAATHRGFAFYVAFPKRSIPSRDVFYVAPPVRSILTS